MRSQGCSTTGSCSANRPLSTGRRRPWVSVCVRYLAAFGEANAAGGVNGRRLELVSYDDGYEPEMAIENTNHLIKDDLVFALIGEVGTPTSNAAQPIATEANVPFIGPFTARLPAGIRPSVT